MPKLRHLHHAPLWLLRASYGFMLYVEAWLNTGMIGYLILDRNQKKTREATLFFYSKFISQPAVVASLFQHACCLTESKHSRWFYLSAPFSLGHHALWEHGALLYWWWVSTSQETGVNSILAAKQQLRKFAHEMGGLFGADIAQFTVVTSQATLWCALGCWICRSPLVASSVRAGCCHPWWWSLGLRNGQEGLRGRKGCVFSERMDADPESLVIFSDLVSSSQE